MGKQIVAVAFIIIFGIGISAQNKTHRVEDLGWLSGCWESNDKAKQLVIFEQWMKPAGGLMLGIGRTVKKERAVDFEFMRIEQKSEDIFFIAKPRQNKEETPFKLIKFASNEAVFENPEHDFPQRVIYKRQDNKLTGRIEGNNKGKFMGIDFPMTRAKCE